MSTYSKVQELNHQGLILYSQDKYEEALDYFTQAMEEDGSYIDSYINTAQVYIMQDDFEQAVKFLDKALLLDKKCAIVYFHLGNVELLMDHTEQAKEHYTKAISLGYDNTQIYINLAADAEEKNDFDTAISYYNKVIALDKFHAYAKARKIEILVALQRVPEALKACDALLETNPDVFEGYHYKFALLADTGKLEQAEEVLNRAIQLFPDDEAFFYDRARLLQAQGRHEDALALLDEKISLEDDNRSDILAFKAQLLLALDKIEEAKSLLTAECEAGNHAQCQYLLTSIYMAENDYEKAAVLSNRTIEMDQYDQYYYAALYYHAVALKRLGKAEEANKAFREAIKILRAATSRQPGQLQLYFYRAICHKELGEFDRATEMIDFVLNVDDTLAEAHMVKAEILEAQGNAEAAQARREQAYVLDPEMKNKMGV